MIKPDKKIFHSKSNVSILDYKTGKPRPADINQIKIYIYKLQQNSYNVNQALLVYLGKKPTILDVLCTDLS